MLTQCALNKYKSIAEGELPDLGQILRKGPIAGAPSTRSAEWSNHGKPIRCRVAPPRSFVQAKEGEEKAAGKVASVVDMIGIMPVGTDIDAKDRFRVNGSVFEVIGTDAGRSSATLLTAQLKRVK